MHLANNSEGFEGMKNGIVEIDHLLTSVNDVSEAAATFGRMGFKVTPLSVISTMGIENRLILLDPKTEGAANFIELMGFHGEPGRAQPHMKRLLEGGLGPRSMVLTTHDAHAARRELLSNGVDPGPVFHVERSWAISADESLDIVFDVMLPYTDAPIPFNLCQYRTLQHYLRPQWRTHANTARHFAAAHYVGDRSTGLADDYGKLFGAAPRASRIAPGMPAVSPGEVEIVFHSPEAFGRWTGLEPVAEGLAGYSIQVERLEAVREILDSGSIPFSTGSTGDLFIAPAFAHGATVHFFEGA